MGQYIDSSTLPPEKYKGSEGQALHAAHRQITGHGPGSVDVHGHRSDSQGHGRGHGEKTAQIDLSMPYI